MILIPDPVNAADRPTTAVFRQRTDCSVSVVSSGVTGLVEMDEFGDRQMDFAVWDMTDVNTGEFQVKTYQNLNHHTVYKHMS